LLGKKGYVVVVVVALIMAFKHQPYVSNAINHNLFFIGDGHLVSAYNISFA